MNSAMTALLSRLRATRNEEAPSTPVMRVQECQKAMDRAAQKIGMVRVTHHDLRHLFATRCMRIYRHLRDHHSPAMAQKVTLMPMYRHNLATPTNAGHDVRTFALVKTSAMFKPIG